MAPELGSLYSVYSNITECYLGPTPIRRTPKLRTLNPRERLPF